MLLCAIFQPVDSLRKMSARRAVSRERMEVDGEKTGRHRDGFGERLDGHVLEFNSDRVFDLCEVLAGDGNPVFAILHQKIAAAGEAGKIVAEMRRQ